MATSTHAHGTTLWLEKIDTGVVARGMDYARRKLVKPVNGIAPDQAREFEVQGSQLYRVILDDANPALSECDCPHANDGHVCKHVVASWLTKHVSDMALPDVPAKAKSTRKSASSSNSKASSKDDERKADLDFLHRQDLPALREWIAQTSERDEALARQLRQWRMHTQDVPRTPAQWRSFVVQSMPARQGMYGRELARWADSALEGLQPLTQQLNSQPGLVRDAAGKALKRLYKTWETADDSGGQLWELYEWLLATLLGSIKAEPPPASWLKEWMELIEADPVGHWSEESFLADAGPALRTAYANWAIDEWQTWCKAHPEKPAPKRRSYDSGDWSSGSQRTKLRRRFLWAMALSQDIPAQLKTRREHTARVEDWVELLDFCNANGQERQAFAYAQEAMKAFPDERQIQQRMLELFQWDGWDEQAMALAQKLLDASPASEECLKTVLDCAARLGVSADAAFAQQLERLLERHTQTTKSKEKTVRIDIALQWLLTRKDWKTALALYARKDTVQPSNHSTQQLAMTLPSTHYSQAVDMLEPLFHARMEYANSPYTHELALARAILQRVPHDQRIAWVQAVTTRYQRRKRLVEGLSALIAQA